MTALTVDHCQELNTILNTLGVHGFSTNHDHGEQINLYEYGLTPEGLETIETLIGKQLAL